MTNPAFVVPTRRRPSWLATAGLALIALAAGAAGSSALRAAAHEPTAPPAAVAPLATAPVPAPAPGVASYSDIVDRVAPAIVTVRVEGRARASATGLPGELAPFFGQRFRGQQPPRARGLGSGVVIRGDGFILTNHHVIDGADTIRVEFADGRSMTARLVGGDQPSDLALLRVEATGLTTVPFGDSDAARVGDVVLAFGNPLGVGQTVTMGIVSAKGRSTGFGDGSYEDFLQTDAPINQGNSGGALVDLRGELLGINAQIVSPSGGNIGLGFAIPSSMARAVADQLIKEGVVRRSKLGVTVQQVTPDLAASLQLERVGGALVSDVEPGGPAARAGLEPGDVITELDGRAVADSNALRNQVANAAPGTTVSLTVRRNGKALPLSARLVERAEEAARAARPAGAGDDGDARLGLTVAPLTPEVAAELNLPRSTTGLVVTGVEPDGAAASAGFQRGDVVQHVNGREVRSVADLRAALEARRDAPALVRVNRGGAHVFVAVPTER